MLNRLFYGEQFLGEVLSNHSMSIDELIEMKNIDINEINEDGNEIYPDFDNFKIVVE
jgi:hypothetical protein